MADLSSRLIAITTAFAGTEVLLYGAVAEPGSDIAVVVRGPPRKTTVRRKSEVGPIWINTAQLTFRNVPSYYAVAASRPLDELADEATLARHELGPQRLKLRPARGETYTPEDLVTYQDALVRNKQRAALYGRDVGAVTFLGGTLFRTRIFFPANVVPGRYDVQVLQFKDGYVADAQSSTLEISKMGLEAEVYDLALQRPAVYGLASILLALAAGWSANMMFRRS